MFTTGGKLGGNEPLDVNAVETGSHGALAPAIPISIAWLSSSSSAVYNRVATRLQVNAC